MEIYKKALLIAFQESIRIGLVSVGLFVAILVLIRKFIKDKALPKWLLWIYTIVGIVIIGVGSVKDFYILHDINEKAYITYYGKYKQRVEGYNDSYYATTLMDGDNVNLLCHFTIATNGEHTGYVVYGERSKIVVYIGEELPLTE